MSIDHDKASQHAAALEAGACAGQTSTGGRAGEQGVDTGATPALRPRALSNAVLFALVAGQVCLHSSMAGLRLALPLMMLRQGGWAGWPAEAAAGVLLGLFAVAPVALARSPVDAMDRAPIREVLDTGIRAINALLTIGRGQRIGLFSGSGVGKSVLLGMMARYTAADVIVVGLIGERGREVKEFIEDILGDDGRARSVVVAAPADSPPMVRMQGAAYATAIAESFRDQGKHVLLLMDSLTRYAMAQREIALAIGEPPATKGYPPSCFAKLPQLVERSGNGLHGVGSITAFYTVLSEGDDQQDPIADAARAILDGHIVLSRSLAEAGHYPAIDVAQSASRVMHNVVPAGHFEMARRFRATSARYEKGRDLVQIGAYVGGSDAAMDRAITLHEPMQAFLQQDMHAPATLPDSLTDMAMVLGEVVQ